MIKFLIICVIALFSLVGCDDTEELSAYEEIETSEQEDLYVVTEAGFTVNNQFFGMSELTSLEIREFYAHIRPDTDREEFRNYRGVSVADILAHFYIDAPDATVIIYSYDGFAASISMDEALQEGQAYIAIWQDGEYFDQREGYWATAPFQLVMAQDIFAQRFARYITEIVIQ